MTAVVLAVASTVTSVSLVVPAVAPLATPERETPTSTSLVLIRSRWMYEHDLLAEARARQRSGGSRREREGRPLPPRLVGPTSTNVLERIAECESHNSYTAENPTSSASGRFQVIKSTWGNYGGYREAKDAPPEVQNRHAQELLARSGTAPWNASKRCWS